MSGRPAGGGASVLGGSHHPPSLRAGRSAALTCSEETQHGTCYCLGRVIAVEPGQPQMAGPPV